MNLIERRQRIEQRLRQQFQPISLEVIDESAAHTGHAGARPGGETHFRVEITSAAFNGLSKVAQHRAVYAALADEIRPDGLHALALETKAAPN